MALTKWQPLSLRHDIEDDGRVGWLELFFDLIYVAALIQLGDRLASDVSWGGGARFAGAFVVLWWTWTGTTAFMNRFAVDDVVHRLLTFVQMFAVGNFAILAVTSLDDRTQWLPLAYVGARIPLLLMYLRARRSLPGARAISDLYMASFGLSAAIWLASIAMPESVRVPMWAVALLLELGVPLFASKRDGAPPTHEHHFRERYALFTIIVLGETFVKTLTELTKIGISWQTQVFGGLTFVVLVALWWTYFDDVAESNIRRRSVLSSVAANNRVYWVYSHLPLTMGLTAFGVASKKVVVVENFGDYLKPSYTWLLGCALVLVLLAVTVLDLVTVSPHHAVDAPERVGPRLLAACAITIIGLAMASKNVNALIGLCIIAAVVVAQIAAEVVVAGRREQRLVTRIDQELSELHGLCADLDNASMPSGVNGGHGCTACAEMDTAWVQLRLCLDCGHVACCDDSPGKHATTHHQETGHAVIATLEHGESWAYCFDHDVVDATWRTRT